MEKSELKLKAHTMRGEDKVIEVWHRGELVATVYGTDGPGIRVISKHPMDIVRGDLRAPVGAIEVRIEPS